MTSDGVVKSFVLALVVRVRFGFGHADLLDDIPTLRFGREHLALERPAEIGHRQAFLLERRLELGVVRQVVRFLDVLQNAGELFVPEREAQFAATLDEEQLVDGVQDELWGDLANRLLRVRGSRA